VLVQGGSLLYPTPFLITSKKSPFYLISKALTRAPEIKLKFRLDRYLLTTLLIERGKCAIATYQPNNNEGPYRCKATARKPALPSNISKA